MVAGIVVLGILAATDAVSTDLLQMDAAPTASALGRAALLFGAAAIIAVALWRRGPRFATGIGAGGLALVAVGTVIWPNAEAYVAAVATTSHGYETDAATVSSALQLRDATGPDVSIAVVTAGAVPYYSERPSIDLLGKSDPVIAASDPHDIPFHPGHDKWDYEYSIGALRPDLVVQLWHEDQSVRTLLEQLGYEHVIGSIWVAEGVGDIDRAALERSVAGS
jgi:hypothetical protein